MTRFLRGARKAVVAAVGLVAAIDAQGLLNGPAARWAAVLISAATLAGVYAVPNQPPQP